MRPRAWIAVMAAAGGLALTAPAVASAHAYLIKTVPAASGVLDTPPRTVALTFD
jgi:methionine-rich copper-binding protein CopC